MSEPLFLRSFEPKDRPRLSTVFLYACKHLGHLKRRSGESYAENGQEVASTLLEIIHDPSLTAIALLHDLPLLEHGEDVLLHAPLTDDERLLVRRMHSLRGLSIDLVSQDLDRLIDAFMQEPKVLPLRMAHRLTDIRHLSRFSKAAQRTLARETLHMYAALAGRLGMHAWRHEMEDICFRLLQPDAAKNLLEQFRLHEKNDLQCLRHIQDFLDRKLNGVGIRPSMSTRTKSLYSTYRKMIVKKRRFEELTDRLALRILVPTIDDCYRTLGIVHSALRPMPGKLKDYIGAPKENGYRSIHTVIYPLPGVTEYPVEIQIRTHEMHEECEFGPARHADYKKFSYVLGSAIARVDLFRNLQSLKQHTRSPSQFEIALRTYFQEDHLALFDHRNNLYHLKKPLTALDFICSVSPSRVRYLKDVRINGRFRPIDTLLHDGDAIEPLFSKTVRCSKEWLKACRHSETRALCASHLSTPLPPERKTVDAGS